MKLGIATAALLWTVTAACSSAPAPDRALVAAPPEVALRAAPSALVERVIDGDTLVLIGGLKVRVLGIDSCEMDTPGGPRAKDQAARRLPPGSRVYLIARPGHETDGFGRALRYVEIPAAGGWRDFGAEMVEADHTAVYGGSNDADRAYVDALRVLDRNGRTC